MSNHLLTPIERQECLSLLRKSRGEAGLVRRANVLLLLDDGKDYATISTFLYLDDATIRSFEAKFKQVGLKKYLSFEWIGSKRHLTSAQVSALKAHVQAQFIGSTRVIIASISKLFGVTYSRSGVIKLLHGLGFCYKKPKTAPRRVDEAAQIAHITAYEQLLNGLQADETVVFSDSSHPQYQSRPAFGWVLKGEKVAVKTVAKPIRLNLQGALNLETMRYVGHEVETVNAQTTLDFLEILCKTYEKSRIIHVFLDNARVHHAKIVKEWLKSPQGARIKLHFLPPYCPHLNPIERLWGMMHKNVTYNRFYEKFETFRQEITTFLYETLPKIKTKAQNYITDRFRPITFDNFRMLK